jgi:3-keto-5-aminohexanoate cleavage enzyme
LAQPLIITVAAVGAEVTLEQQPNLPISPEQLARDARACEAAGAAIYHLHVRDDDGAPSMEVERFRRAHDAITEATDLIVQFTSGGAVGDGAEARVAPLVLRPEMATLTTGTVNFGTEIFLNPAPLVERLYRKMREGGTLPEFEIFEAGMIANATRLYSDHGDGHHCHFDFVLGVPGALPAVPGAISFLRSLLPDGATWSATGIGRAHFRVMQEALEVGGHVRTGFEDVRYVEPGRRATSNAELVEKVASLAADRDRVVVGPQEARDMLGLSGRGTLTR